MKSSTAGTAAPRKGRLFGRPGPHPGLRVGFAWPFARAAGLERGVRVALPFRRSPVAIGIVGVMFAIFFGSFLSVAGSLADVGGGDLFSIIFVAFELFWLLGWSVAVIGLGLVLLVLVAGREVLRVERGHLRLRIEVLGFGAEMDYDVAYMRNLRSELPDERGGTAWRGPHLAFDYGTTSVGFGSNVEGAAAVALLERVRGALGEPVPDGPAPAAPAAGPIVDPAPEPAPVSDTPAAASALTQPAAPAPPVTLGSPSTLALIASNLVPLAGVLLLDWSIGEVMLLYWAESAIIGVFNLLKMAVVGRWATLFYGPFFVGHYGGFMAGHLLFISGLFLAGPDSGVMVETATLVAAFTALWPALLALAVSHAISYRLNFIGRREHAGRTVGEQMGEPYKRIIVMHVTIIFGGFLVMALDSALPALVLLIALKVAADLRAHLREHRGSAPEDAG